MRQKYRMFLRGSVYWTQDNETGKQDSLRTKDRSEAKRLLHAKNEACRQPIINMQIARAYLLVGDPEVAKRDWQFVMDEIVKLKHSETKRRWLVAIKDRALDGIRSVSLMETRAEHFLRAMEKGKVSTNIYLRRIHNFALGMNWLPVPVIAKRMWPTFSFKEKRAITLEEHKAIVARETNQERRAFYELAWHIGASQSDIAFLEAENVDWEKQVVSYTRKKSGELAFIRFGKEVERILSDLPSTGPLFPYLRTVRAGDRATEFKQRCRGLKSKASASTPTAMRGPSGREKHDTRNDSRRKPSGTTARRFIGPTREKQRSSCPLWRVTRNRSPRAWLSQQRPQQAHEAANARDIGLGRFRTHVF